MTEVEMKQLCEACGHESSQHQVAVCVECRQQGVVCEAMRASPSVEVPYELCLVQHEPGRVCVRQKGHPEPDRAREVRVDALEEFISREMRFELDGAMAYRIAEALVDADFRQFAVEELVERLTKAIDRLDDLENRHAGNEETRRRLIGKVEGVRLALGYVEEQARVSWS